MKLNKVMTENMAFSFKADNAESLRTCEENEGKSRFRNLIAMFESSDKKTLAFLNKDDKILTQDRRNSQSFNQIKITQRENKFLEQMQPIQQRETSTEPEEDMMYNPRQAVRNDSNFFDGDEDDQYFLEMKKDGGGGIRTEFADTRPYTPYECENLRVKSTENMTFPAMSNVYNSKNERPSTRRSSRPERPSTKLPSRPERPHMENKFEPNRPQIQPKINQLGPKYPEQSETESSLATYSSLASKVVEEFAEYQRKIFECLDSIHEIITEPYKNQVIHDIHDRHRRCNEFVKVFVRNNLYPIGRLAENIRAMSHKSIDAFFKVYNMFQLIYKAVNVYNKNLKGFIYNNRPKKLETLMDFIVNGFKAATERRACSSRDEGIMRLIFICDRIKFCLRNCNREGFLHESNASFTRHAMISNMKKYYEDKERSKRIAEERSNKINVKDCQASASTSSSDISLNMPKLKVLKDEDYNEKRLKKIRTYWENFNIYYQEHNDYACPTDKIWNNEEVETNENSNPNMIKVAASHKNIHNAKSNNNTEDGASKRSKLNSSKSFVQNSNLLSSKSNVYDIAGSENETLSSSDVQEETDDSNKCSSFESDGLIQKIQKKSIKFCRNISSDDLKIRRRKAKLYKLKKIIEKANESYEKIDKVVQKVNFIQAEYEKKMAEKEKKSNTSGVYNRGDFFVNILQMTVNYSQNEYNVNVGSAIQQLES